jgi:hypothetical protein
VAAASTGRAGRLCDRDGKSRSIRELMAVLSERVGLDLEPYIRIDQRFRRPADVGLLESDASKAGERLGPTRASRSRSP